MGFEHFESRFDDAEDINKAKELYKNGERNGVDNDNLADGPSNSSNLEKQKVEAERTQEQQEKQEKQKQALDNLKTVENTERQQEIAQANQNMDQNLDMWPPVSFDDVNNLTLKSNAGHTEGGTSLDQEKN